MQRVALLVVVLFALLFCTSAVLGDAKIQFGQEAEVGEFPFMLELDLDDFPRCGATLIAPQYVLTAAHCINGTATKNFSVRGGSVNLFDGESVAVKSIHIPSDYRIGPRQNDVALLKLKKPFSSDTKVRTIKLARKFKPAGTWFKTSGWGVTEEGYPSLDLHWTRVQKISPRECRKVDFYKEIFNPAVHLCVFNPPKGACFLDDGGPLFVGSGSGATQYGILAGGVNCGLAPTIYAKMKHFIDWIRNETEHSICVDTTNYYEYWTNMRAMCTQMGGTAEKMVDEGRFCCHNLNAFSIRKVSHSWSTCNSTSPVAEFCWRVGRYTCEDDVAYCSVL